MIILSSYFVKNELNPLKNYVSRKDLVEAALKIKKGLGLSLNKISNSKFRYFKVRLGNKAKARMIVFMTTDTGNIVPVLLRLKKDKKIGMNMSVENSNVLSQIEKNVDRIIDDYLSGNYEEIALEVG